METFYQLAVLLCTMAPGLPEECVTAYIARQPATQEIALFPTNDHCKSAAVRHRYEMNLALKATSQRSMISTRTQCGKYDVK